MCIEEQTMGIVMGPMEGPLVGPLVGPLMGPMVRPMVRPMLRLLVSPYALLTNQQFDSEPSSRYHKVNIVVSCRNDKYR